MKKFGDYVLDYELEDLTTEENCIKWVQIHLPFAVASKSGTLQYPFKSAHIARTIEEHLGKSLFKLLHP
jgi:hypothetical protein